MLTHRQIGRQTDRQGHQSTSITGGNENILHRKPKQNMPVDPNSNVAMLYLLYLPTNNSLTPALLLL